MAEVKGVTGAPDGQVVVSGKDSAGAPVQHAVEADTAFERISAAAVQTGHQIQGLYDRASQQANLWFIASAAAAILGFILVVTGIVTLLFFRQDIAVILSTGLGLLLEAVARLFFQQSKDANKRVDGYLDDLQDARQIYEAIELVKTSESPETRDRLRQMIIERLLGMDGASEATNKPA